MKTPTQMLKDAEKQQKMTEKFIKEAKAYGRVVDKEDVSLIKNILAFHRI